MTTYQIAEELCNRLAEFFIVHKYCATTTNSVYIKLDYGVANSIRVSDHNGIEKYKYKYNIRKDIEEKYEEVDDNYLRKYYPFKDIGDLILDVIVDREMKKVSIGKEQYYKQMEEKKIQSESATNSFWRYCTKLKRGKEYESKEAIIGEDESQYYLDNS